MNSRLIVKNIPKNLKETELKKKFEKFGVVTDAKIIFKGTKNRRFCFVGYLDPKAAEKAQKYFHQSYLGTSKILVDFAKDVGDDSLKKISWSKYTVGTTAFNKKNKIVPEQQLNEVDKKNEKQETEKVTANMEKLEEFIDLMKTGKNPISFSDNVLTTLEDSSKQVSNPIDLPLKKKVKKENDQQNQQNDEVKVEQNNETDIPTAKRLYVVNLPFNVSDEDIRKIFEKYGDITELKLPKGRGGVFRGYAFITYDKPEQALRVMTELNNKTVLGRRIFIKTAEEEKKKEENENEKKDENNQDNQNIENNDDNNENNVNKQNKVKKENKEKEELPEKKRVLIAKSSYKKQKQKQLFENINDEINWNTLFLNPNTVVEVVSQKFHMNKNEWFEGHKEDLAIKQALAETQVITETKEWFMKEGLSLDFLDKNRQKCKRSRDTIFIKNLPFKINEPQLEELFLRYGKIRQIKLAPNRAIGIVQYTDEKFATNAFTQLQEYTFKNEPLYLEWAPQNLFTSKLKNDQEAENKEMDAENTEEKQNVLFIKNLNFETTEAQLKKFLDEMQIKGLISTKIIYKNDEKGQKLSAGYGFLEFLNNAHMMNCLKKIQNQLLDNHSLQISISSQNKQKQNKKDIKTNKNQVDNVDKQSTKLIIRNIAFEATKHDIKEIVKHFGELKIVRLPKKMNGQHRGFAFVEFVNVQEAKNAFVALQNTHLYKRKLNIEWADN